MSLFTRVKETNEAQNLQVSRLKVIENPNLPLVAFSPKTDKEFFYSFFYLFYRNLCTPVLQRDEFVCN